MHIILKISTNYQHGILSKKEGIPGHSLNSTGRGNWEVATPPPMLKLSNTSL